MAIVTLTTDLGLQDYYLAAIKGTLLTHFNDLNIVDITHQVPSFDIFKAAEILQNSYPFFPKGTIHCVAVNNESVIKAPLLAALYNGHYFVGPDNGLFSFLFDQKPEELIRITPSVESQKSTFPFVFDYIKVIQAIEAKNELSSVGKATETYIEKNPLRAYHKDDLIQGYIWHIDKFGNAITNISKELFEKAGKGQKFKLMVKRGEYGNLQQHYDDRKSGELVLLFNYLNLLEIAICNGNASQLLGIQRNERITIHFGKLLD